MKHEQITFTKVTFKSAKEVKVDMLTGDNLVPFNNLSANLEFIQDAILEELNKQWSIFQNIFHQIMGNDVRLEIIEYREKEQNIEIKFSGIRYFISGQTAKALTPWIPLEDSSIFNQEDRIKEHMPLISEVLYKIFILKLKNTLF